MQLNYSYLKIFKLKINFLFLIMLLCALLAIRFFLSFSFSTENPQFLSLVSFEVTKDPKWPPFEK